MKQSWLPQLQIALELHTESSITQQSKSRTAQYILQNKHETQLIPTVIIDLCFRFYFTRGIPLSRELIERIVSDIQENNYYDLDEINFDLYQTEFPMAKEVLRRIVDHMNRGHVFSNLDDKYIYDMIVIGYLDLYSAYDCKHKGNDAFKYKNRDLALEYYAKMGMHLGDDVKKNEFHVDRNYLKFERDWIHNLKLIAFILIFRKVVAPTFFLNGCHCVVIWGFAYQIESSTVSKIARRQGLIAKNTVRI